MDAAPRLPESQPLLQILGSMSMPGHLEVLGCDDVHLLHRGHADEDASAGVIPPDLALPGFFTFPPSTGPPYHCWENFTC